MAAVVVDIPEAAEEDTLAGVEDMEVADTNSLLLAGKLRSHLGHAVWVPGRLCV